MANLTLNTREIAKVNNVAIMAGNDPKKLVAIITYCLVAIVQYDMQLNRSTYEVLQILSISLTDKTPLQELFNKTNFNDVKEQFNPLIPGLFD